MEHGAECKDDQPTRTKQEAKHRKEAEEERQRFDTVKTLTVCTPP